MKIQRLSHCSRPDPSRRHRLLYASEHDGDPFPISTHLISIFKKILKRRSNTVSSQTHFLALCSTAWKPSFRSASLGPFELLHGSESRLHCNPSAAPRPSFQWFRNGILISSENSSRYEFQQNGTLIIKKVDKEDDEGNYTCKARNFLGEDSASAAVIVYGKIQY